VLEPVDEKCPKDRRLLVELFDLMLLGSSG
jgi:hypothetical protein